MGTIPVPRHLGPDQVLIQVKAIGVDNIDGRIAAGYRHSLRNHLGLSSVSTFTYTYYLYQLRTTYLPTYLCS